MGTSSPHNDLFLLDTIGRPTVPDINEVNKIAVKISKIWMPYLAIFHYLSRLNYQNWNRSNPGYDMCHLQQIPLLDLIQYIIILYTCIIIIHFSIMFFRFKPLNGYNIWFTHQ